MTAAKAWIGMLIAFVGSLFTVWAASGDFTVKGFVAAVGAAIATGGLVYRVPNDPPSM